MLAIYQDWSNGDHSFIDVISDDDGMIVIGTDPTEWWKAGPHVKAIFHAQVDEMAGLRITAGELNAFSHGDVGWVVDNPTFSFPNDIEVLIRSSVVFVREPAGWRIVHWHVSVGQGNEETLGMELTTSIDVLAEWADEVKPDLTPTASPEGTVTIVFTDIEASTALNTELGDDRFLEVIRHHDELVRSAVAAHGGTTVKGAGDGFMLAFPSARRGIECAVKLQRDIAERDDPPIRMRVGMHTGEPLRHGDDFFGRDVAYAARVGAVARGGEILVSDLVKSLCAGTSFGFEGPREVEFKGFDGTQNVYAVPW